MSRPTTRRPSHPATRSFLAAALLASTAGAAWGVLCPSFRMLERVRTSVHEVERLGQDVNGDGVATALEGRIDVDGDGRFGDAEARMFGMESYIVWDHGGEGLDGPTELEIANSCCVIIPGAGPRKRACLLFPPTPGVTCIANGTTCVTQ